MSLETRINRLEEAARPSGVVVVWRNFNETDEQAKERWCREHPGEDLDRADLSVIIIGWLHDGESGIPVE